MSTSNKNLIFHPAQTESSKKIDKLAIKSKTHFPNSHTHNGKSTDFKLITSPFNIICQYKAKLHEDTFVFCEDCHIYFCTACDNLYHSPSQSAHLLGHVRKSVVRNSNNCEDSSSPLTTSPSAQVKVNNNNMMPALDSLQLNDHFGDNESNKFRSLEPGGPERGFLLINEREKIEVQSFQEFIKKLGCPERDSVKVVSIFGNTGEGKSYTLNQIFYSGKEVFRTSPSQTSCTLGVWAAYHPGLNVITLDTEGLLGSTTNQNHRTRLLLKVMAISDVVIYRTRAERLHSDMYLFLSDASKAFNSHFKKELQAASERCKIEGPLSQLGPYVIIFHETHHTNILKSDKNQESADILRQAFHDQKCHYDAFSGLKYVGTKTQSTTDFSGLTKVIKKQIKLNDVRSFRSPNVIFQVLQMLNNKFSGHIENTIAEAFPDQYFTCSEKCRACGARCCNSTNHRTDNIPHESKTKCKFQHQHQNRRFLCKPCHVKGETSVVIPRVCSTTDSSWIGIAKFAWAGYVIECDNCGILYQSRRYWYGNRDPSEYLHTEIQHVWPGELSSSNGSLNVGQKLLDGITYLSSTVSNVSAAPSKSVSSWVADLVAPQYWTPNSEIIKCHLCGYHFELTDDKHHCRACGQGFCEECSNFSRPVPERGWGVDKPVRVCKSCINIHSTKDDEPYEQEVIVRKVGEMLSSTIGTVVAAMEYPKGIIKDSARPSYWVPDEHIIECFICHCEFTPKVTIHHCRACGQGVCGDCSPEERPVPLRGWSQPVRVCKTCVEAGEWGC